HAVPSRKTVDVLLHVLRAQRKVIERRRHGSPNRSTVKRKVYDREGGSCAFVGEEGRRCGSRDKIEYQHIVPEARGGQFTEDNITLHCQKHNLHQAKKDFG